MSAMPDSTHAEALFLSYVQRSTTPSADLIRHAVTDTMNRVGAGRCAELVAQEYGEHPDSAAGRMLWARTAILLAFP